MSFNHSHNENSIRRKKLDELAENVRSVTKFKRLALKYYTENGVQSFQSTKLSKTNYIHELGIYIFFQLFL